METIKVLNIIIVISIITTLVLIGYVIYSSMSGKPDSASIGLLSGSVVVLLIATICRIFYIGHNSDVCNKLN